MYVVIFIYLLQVGAMCVQLVSQIFIVLMDTIFMYVLRVVALCGVKDQALYCYKSDAC